MSRTIGIGIFSIQIFNNEMNGYYDLNNIIRNKSIIDILNDYIIERNEQPLKDDLNNKIIDKIEVKEKEEDDDENIFVKGVATVGEFGYSSKYKNVITHEEKFERDKYDAELKEFYFGIKVPKNNIKRGIIVFQTISQHSIKNIFTNDFKSFIDKVYGEKYELIIGTLTTKEYLMNYLNNSRLVKVRYTKFYKPTDEVDKYNENFKTEDQFDESYEIKAKKKCSLENAKKTLIKAIESNSDTSKIINLNSFQEYDNCKVDIVNGKRIKVINLNKINEMNFTYDISDEIELNDKGNPTYDSISKIVDEYIEEFLEK